MKKKTDTRRKFIFTEKAFSKKLTTDSIRTHFSRPGQTPGTKGACPIIITWQRRSGLQTRLSNKDHNKKANKNSNNIENSNIDSPKFIGSSIRRHHHERDNYSTKIPDATSESVDMNQFKIEQK
jgi:hypothetical protein